MGFKMHCPKCGSTAYSIERDGRSYFSNGPSSELIFSCRCGKQLFGEQLEKEFNRQLAAYEAQAEERKAEERERADERRAQDAAAADRREREAHRREHDEKKKAAETADSAQRKQEADRRWRERVSSKGPDKPSPDALPPGTPPNKDDALCSWGPCMNESRDNSKYCSRVCSNKNARWRHKMRKAAKRAAKKAKKKEQEAA